MSSKLSLFTTLFLILGPIYQKVRHLLGARPRGPRSQARVDALHSIHLTRTGPSPKVSARGDQV